MLQVPVRGRGGRRGPVAVLAALLVGLVLWLTGCSAAPGIIGATPSGPATTPTLRASGVSYTKSVTVKVTDGKIVSLTAHSGDDEKLPGTVSGDGSSWSSTDPPKPGRTYTAEAVFTNDTRRTVDFTVPTVPATKRLGFTVTPDDGETVGIGQPVVVRFLSTVEQRADVERRLTVTATTPGGEDVVGSWHWVNGKQIDWRPEEFWEPGTKVDLVMAIAGVKASPGHYGRKDYTESFTIGASHVTKVDARTDRVRVYRDGKLVDTWPTGTGKPGLETYSGTYVVLGKARQVQMSSCGAGITCDTANPDYYSGPEYWATRITASGTFLHAASWDGQLGSANTSHGCIHLSDADAKDFYEHAVVGDVVIVKNTGRGPQERIATQDPGLYDWNIPWSRWKQGSAL